MKREETCEKETRENGLKVFQTGNGCERLCPLLSRAIGRLIKRPVRVRGTATVALNDNDRRARGMGRGGEG